MTIQPGRLQSGTSSRAWYEMVSAILGLRPGLHSAKCQTIIFGSPVHAWLMHSLLGGSYWNSDIRASRECRISDLPLIHVGVKSGVSLDLLGPQKWFTYQNLQYLIRKTTRTCKKSSVQQQYPHFKETFKQWYLWYGLSSNLSREIGPPPLLSLKIHHPGNQPSVA